MPSPSDAAPREPPPTRNFVLAGLVVVGVHLALTFHFLPPSVAFGSQPITGDDFDVHIGQTYRVLQGMDGWGKSWVYDVQLLAGEPAGVIFDGDNKGWTVFTYILWKAGLERGLAFNLFVLLSFLAVVPVVYASARLFELGRWPALGATALASALWFFDSFAHWVWWVGMVAYGFASYLALLPLAMFYRFTKAPSVGMALGLAALLPVAHLIHPYTFFILVLPMGVMYLRARKRLPLPAHLAVVGIAACTVALNLYWLVVAIEQWHYILNSAFYGRNGVEYVLADFLNLLLSPSDTGVIGTRAAFRFIGFVLAVVGLLRLRRAGDDRYLPLSLTLVFMLVLGYLGAYIPGANQVQPYRHILPASFIAVLPAAWMLCRWFTEGALSGLTPATRGVFALCVMLGGQHLAREVLYYFPGQLPAVPDLLDGYPSPLTAMGYPRHFDYRLPHDPNIQAGADKVVEWVRKNVASGERVLVDGWMLGERIAWSTQAEVMGGAMRNIAHADAHYFRFFAGREVSPPELRQYLHVFGIRWIIVHERNDDFEHAEGLLEHYAQVQKRHIYRTVGAVGPLLGETGQVLAGTNRIVVRSTRPDRSLVLSYHFHEALRCAPDCRIERVEIPYDRVGLIRVPAPHPADFVIENQY